jgi:ribosomal protein S18 acetylase RimI-like enzyme
MTLRAATNADWPLIWTLLQPVFRAGETYAVDRTISADAAHQMWMTAPHSTYVMETEGQITGTYYIKTNAAGGGAHVCNCGYVVAEAAQGQGIARAMCEHSLSAAKDAGYTAMQFNMVLATNKGAVALWHKLGFETVGTLPQAFDHPAAGLVDGFVMFRAL